MGVEKIAFSEVVFYKTQFSFLTRSNNKHARRFARDFQINLMLFRDKTQWVRRTDREQANSVISHKCISVSEACCKKVRSDVLNVYPIFC